MFRPGEQYVQLCPALSDEGLISLENRCSKDGVANVTRNSFCPNPARPTFASVVERTVAFLLFSHVPTGFAAERRRRW